MIFMLHFNIILSFLGAVLALPASEVHLEGSFTWKRIKGFDGDPNCYNSTIARVSEDTYIGIQRWTPRNGCGLSDLFYLFVTPEGNYEAYRVNSAGTKGELACKISDDDYTVVGNIVRLTAKRKCDYGGGSTFISGCKVRDAASGVNLRDLENLCPSREYKTVRCT